MSIDKALAAIDNFTTTARASYISLVRQVVEKPDEDLDPRRVRDVLSAAHKSVDELRADIAVLQERFAAYFSDAQRSELTLAKSKLAVEVDRLESVFNRVDESEGAKITAARKLIAIAEGAFMEKRHARDLISLDIIRRENVAKETLGGSHWCDGSLLFQSR